VSVSPYPTCPTCGLVMRDRVTEDAYRRRYTGHFKAAVKPVKKEKSKGAS
jgi:hypothetical protein